MLCSVLGGSCVCLMCSVLVESLLLSLVLLVVVLFIVYVGNCWFMVIVFV